MFQRRVIDASIANQPVIQPTGQEMLRYWQAYLSVKDTLVRQPQQRELLVLRPTTQIRLPVLVSTVAIFLSAIVAASLSQYLVQRRLRGRRLHLPSSELGWTVQAVRENYRGRDVILATESFVDFPKRHDVRFATTIGPDGEVLTWLQAKGRDVEAGADERSDQTLITKKCVS